MDRSRYQTFVGIDLGGARGKSTAVALLRRAEEGDAIQHGVRVDSVHMRAEDGTPWADDTLRLRNGIGSECKRRYRLRAAHVEDVVDAQHAGRSLASPDYAALVFWYRNELVLRHDDDGIMSRGTVVRPWHYVTFLEALESLTGTPDWSIVEP